MALARLFRISRQRIKSAAQKQELDSQLDNELAFHFDQLVSEHVADGMSPDEARYAARRKLGNVSIIEEQCRDHRRMGWLHDLRQDFLYGLRMLRKSPGFTAVAAISLAIGIGANTAILSAMDAIILGSLPVSDPDRIVLLRTYPLGSPNQQSQASVPDFLAWKERNDVFESMGAYISDQRDFGAGEDGSPPERIIGEGVTPGLFKTLRVQPLLGRLFTEEEDQVDHQARVMLISYQLWQRRFGGDPNIINRELRLSSGPVTIIGVMPPSFRYPLENLDYWAPMSISTYQLQGSARLFTVTARLKEGVTIQRAQAEMDAIAAQLVQEFPSRHKGWGVRLQSLRVTWFAWIATPLLTLQASVTLVLLIVCANVAGLLLARGSVRRPEIAMRVALGAGRGRILRQFLTESILLSLIGGALSLLVAWPVLRALSIVAPPFPSQRAVDISINLHTLGWMMLLSIVTGLIFGAAPAMSAVKLELNTTLGAAGRAFAGSRNRQYFRSALVAVQISLALVLMISAGLLANSFVRMISRDMNFDPRGVFTFEFRVPLGTYLKGTGTERGIPYFDVNPPTQIMSQVYERVARIPGVQSVGGISLPPVNSILIPNPVVLAEGHPYPQTEVDRSALHANYFLITPNTFYTLRSKLVRGREFTAQDTDGAPWGAVINETMARRFWPGEDPIGKRFMFDGFVGEQLRQVIGVVSDIPLTFRQTTPEPVVYTSYFQQSPRFRSASGNMFGRMTFMLRTSANLNDLVPAIRKAVSEVDPDRPLTNLVTMEQLSGNGLPNERLFVAGMGFFAFAATLLAAVGIYGLMSYSIAQRTREIGVRMALGAGAMQVLTVVSRRALMLIAFGLVTGIVASIYLTRLLVSQLWGVTPTDPGTFAAVSALLAAVGLTASFVPARRATRVDPAVTLRSE